MVGATQDKAPQDEWSGRNHRRMMGSLVRGSRLPASAANLAQEGIESSGGMRTAQRG